jgi:hypothetical protein
VFTTARYWTLATADEIQSNPYIHFLKIHCHIIRLCFQIGSWKQKDTEPNVSEYPRNLICSSFILQSNFNCNCHFQIFELCSIFKSFISYMLLKGIYWVVFQENVLHFLLYSWQMHVRRSHWIVL